MLVDPIVPFSVLMSVYEKESPTNLECALNSIFRQSLLPNEVVLVKDGPLPLSLDIVIDRFLSLYPEFRVVTIDKNVGLGSALSYGLSCCSYELVARMDTDDISSLDRFAIQIPFMASNEQLSVVGSWVAEFESDPSFIVSLRKVPTDSDDIKRLAQYRCPINHPTVVFRKSHIISVGGYNSNHLFYEDYCLWRRLLMSDFKLYNIPKVLVFMRTGNDFYERRGGFKYLKSDLQFFFELYKVNFIGVYSLFKNVSVRFILRLIPSKFRKFFYFKFSRTIL